MQSVLLDALRSREEAIRARWRELLRVEAVNSPLAQPETLTHLIDWTVAEIFSALGAGRHRRSDSDGCGTPNRSLCACGRNPLLSYFDAAGQALREALILAQASLSFLDPIERDTALEELNMVLQHVARREISAFCGVCQHRLKNEHAECGAMLQQSRT